MYKHPLRTELRSNSFRDLFSSDNLATSLLPSSSNLNEWKKYVLQRSDYWLFVRICLDRFRWEFISEYVNVSSCSSNHFISLFSEHKYIKKSLVRENDVDDTDSSFYIYRRRYRWRGNVLHCTKFSREKKNQNIKTFLYNHFRFAILLHCLLSYFLKFISKVILAQPQFCNSDFE